MSDRIRLNHGRPSRHQSLRTVVLGGQAHTTDELIGAALIVAIMLTLSAAWAAAACLVTRLL